MTNSIKELNFTIEGTGPKLIMIHGFLESNLMWKPLQLEKNFTCVRIELPGHGSSKIDNSEWSVSFMADCLKATIDRLEIVEFDMIGHSLGGYVVLEYASKFRLPGKLILLHSNFWEDNAKKKIDRQRVASIVLRNKNLFLNEALPSLFLEPQNHFTEINNLLLDAKEMSAKDIADCSLAMQKRKDHRSTLKKYSSNISIIQGELDRLVPIEKMQEMLVGLQNKVIVIPKVGHMGQHENPTLLRHAIIKLLA
jgi:2-succinyl-6-hydroxy-2,4-cyclohexadiene-1-carboxylate synthase